MFPSIFIASTENFCCSLLLSLSASANGFKNASSLSRLRSFYKRLHSRLICYRCCFGLLSGRFLPILRLFGVFFGALLGVLAHFPCLLLFSTNKDFANLSSMTRLPQSQKCLLHQTGQVDHRIEEVADKAAQTSSSKFLYQDILINFLRNSGPR